MFGSIVIGIGIGIVFIANQGATGTPVPPVTSSYLLADGTAYLLADGTNMLLA